MGLGCKKNIGYAILLLFFYLFFFGLALVCCTKGLMSASNWIARGNGEDINPPPLYAQDNVLYDAQSYFLPGFLLQGKILNSNFSSNGCEIPASQLGHTRFMSQRNDLENQLYDARNKMVDVLLCQKLDQIRKSYLAWNQRGTVLPDVSTKPPVDVKALSQMVEEHFSPILQITPKFVSCRECEPRTAADCFNRDRHVPRGVASYASPSSPHIQQAQFMTATDFRSALLSQPPLPPSFPTSYSFAVQQQQATATRPARETAGGGTPRRTAASTNPPLPLTMLLPLPLAAATTAAAAAGPSYAAFLSTGLPPPPLARPARRKRPGPPLDDEGPTDRKYHGGGGGGGRADGPQRPSRSDAIAVARLVTVD
jgi:hypothetical protein